LEILPSPNSKSLGAYFLMDAYIFDKRRDFNVRLVYIVYYVGAHILQFRIAWAHVFWTCAYILDMRIYFEHAHIFWTCAYILRKRIHFEQTPIFCVYANKFFVAANICVYFQYLFMHFCVRQYFWYNCLKPRFKIDAVIMIICSIVIIINSVLTLQVSTATIAGLAK
jgi:hypothetical protein